MEKMGTLKKKWGPNGDQKSYFGPHGDQSPQMGTNLGAVFWVWTRLSHDICDISNLVKKVRNRDKKNA